MRVSRLVVAVCMVVGAMTPIQAAQTGSGRIPVWIDTDPSCGEGLGHDVDDCLALIQALNSPEIEIVGIGTVFGNTDGKTRAAYRLPAGSGCGRLPGRSPSHK